MESNTILVLVELRPAREEYATWLKIYANNDSDDEEDNIKPKKP
jgi:hypothetical protein